MNYYISALKKYAVFNGRARRKEFWTFFLFNLIIGFALGFIGGMFGIASKVKMVANIYSLAILIPSIAVTMRRMHDVNKDGWYAFIPIYSWILAFRDGTKGDNKYGSDPKEIKSN